MDTTFLASFVVLGCLAYGSYHDVKTREIPDTLWVLMGVTGVLLRIMDSQWKITGISVGVAFLLGLLLAASGMFGGADIKAFLALSLVIPTYEGVVLPLFVLSVFNNLAVIRVAEIFAVFFYNIVTYSTCEGVPLWKKAVLYMTGIPRSREDIDYRFLPLQDIEGNLHLLPDIDVDVDEFKEKCNLQKVWVTYGSPLILYMLIACVIALTKGDLVLHLILFFTG